MKTKEPNKMQAISHTHAGRVIHDLMATVDQAIARVRAQIQQTGKAQ